MPPQAYKALDRAFSFFILSVGLEIKRGFILGVSNNTHKTLKFVGFERAVEANRPNALISPAFLPFWAGFGSRCG